MFANFAKLDSPRRLVQFWQNLQTSLVLLIPNCTRQRMITYTNVQYSTNRLPIICFSPNGLVFMLGLYSHFVHNNTAVKCYAHARDLRKARENVSQIVYKEVQTEQKHKK